MELEYLLSDESMERENQFLERFPHGEIWNRHTKKTIPSSIGHNESPIEKLHELQKHSLIHTDPLDENVDYEFELWEKYLKKRHKIDLKTLDKKYQESPICLKEKTFNQYNKLFSLNFLSHLAIMFDVVQYCKDLPKNPVFLEIGAGFGSQARLFKIKYPKCKYIIVDLPKILYSAGIFLKENFPDDKIELFEGSNLDEVKNADIILVPFYLCEKIPDFMNSVDIIFNSNSIGEMNRKMVHFYYDFFENTMSTDYLVWINRFLNFFDPILDKNRLNENSGAGSLGDCWEDIYWDATPEYKTFHSERSSNTLYFIGRKYSNQKEREEDIKKTKKDMERIMSRVWYKDFNVGPRSHLLNFDNDTLHVLFNSVRLNPKNVKYLDALIKYLFINQKYYPFEDIYYYFDRYKKLTGNNHFLQNHPYLPIKINHLFKRLGLYEGKKQFDWFYEKKLKGGFLDKIFHSFLYSSK